MILFHKKFEVVVVVTFIATIYQYTTNSLYHIVTAGRLEKYLNIILKILKKIN